MDTTSPGPRDHLQLAIFDEIEPLEASILALKFRHNELSPISRLPFEVLAATFSFLSLFAWNEGSGHMAWINVTHVCRRWRETALNHPRLWSHINFTNLTSAGMVEILSRAKMAPLHLEAVSPEWNAVHSEDFERHLEAHISHTRHLKYEHHLSRVVRRLVSPAPTLESLSLSHKSILSYIVIPENLFNCTAPSLTSLKLDNCDISWKSPLLKGLQILEIVDLTANARPELNDWLDALNEMPQLKRLFLRFATPIAPLASPLISEPSRTITLPSLTHFKTRASAKDCALALAHLVLPSLTLLHVDVESHEREGEDALLVIPYVVRNVYVLQGIEPIRSILIASEGRYTQVLTSTTPGTDVEVCGPDTRPYMLRSACLQFGAIGYKWKPGVDIAILDAVLTLLPMNSVSTLTAQNRTRLSKEFWLKHASRLPLLEQVRLVPTAVGAFKEMLAEDIPLDSDGPRLPMLTKLILLNVRLNVTKMFHLRDMLIERVEQGVPLECLDLRTCFPANPAIQWLAEIVVDVQEPPGDPPMSMMDFLKGYKGTGIAMKLNFTNTGSRVIRISTHFDTDDDEDSDGDKDDSEDEDSDGDEDDSEGEDSDGDEDDSEDEDSDGDEDEGD